MGVGKMSKKKKKTFSKSFSSRETKPLELPPLGYYKIKAICASGNLGGQDEPVSHYLIVKQQR